MRVVQILGGSWVARNKSGDYNGYVRVLMTPLVTALNP